MPVAALQVWLRCQALVWLPALVASAWAGPASMVPPWPWYGAVAMAVSHAVLVLVLRAGRRAADVVTLFRFALLVLLLAVGHHASPAVVWCTATAAVLLDLVDGIVARRCGGSPAGAVLDMETDQCTVMTLAMLVVGGGGGVHVLVLPALRHGFVLAMWVLGAPAHDPKPKAGDNRRGRRVCAAVLCCLLFALLPGLPATAGDVATAVAVLLLAWSFGDDARFLARHSRARAVAP